MTDPELVSYITLQTQGGIGADMLRQTLIKEGWQEADIDNALHDVAAGLAPATAGASIHEDLAQVRGMVAHLASRVRVLEAGLASVGTLPMQAQLPAPRARGVPFGIRHAVALVVAGIALLLVYRYAAILIAQDVLAPLWQIGALAGLGLALLVIALVTMQARRAWVASLTADTSIAILAMASWAGYSVYHFMGRSTALALGVLLAVALVVMESWIDRLARGQ
jgi:hypothetical protein